MTPWSTTSSPTSNASTRGHLRCPCRGPLRGPRRTSTTPSRSPPTRASPTTGRLLASYRWSQLKGNFEGFFRSDNGQSDPAISSLFDFPTNDPSYTAIGAPQFGFRGDIRFQGARWARAVLPNDRPHQVKLYGNYAWGNLNVGLGFNVGSGRPLTALAANPAYDNGGEIPETLRGGGIQTSERLQGARRQRYPGRPPRRLHPEAQRPQRVILLADVFNLLNNQDPLDYDNWTEIAAGTVNPNGPLRRGRPARERRGGHGAVVRGAALPPPGRAFRVVIGPSSGRREPA